MNCGCLPSLLQLGDDDDDDDDDDGDDSLLDVNCWWFQLLC